MQLVFFELAGRKFAKLVASGIVLKDEQDAVELAANCAYQEVEGLILEEKNIIPEFFDLKTKIAGDVLQKFTNYKVKLAIVGDYSKFESKSLSDFIHESNKGGKIIFVRTMEEAERGICF